MEVFMILKLYTIKNGTIERVSFSKSSVREPQNIGGTARDRKKIAHKMRRHGRQRTGLMFVRVDIEIGME